MLRDVTSRRSQQARKTSQVVEVTQAAGQVGILIILGLQAAQARRGRGSKMCISQMLHIHITCVWPMIIIIINFCFYRQ